VEQENEGEETDEDGLGEEHLVARLLAAVVKIWAGTGHMTPG